MVEDGGVAPADLLPVFLLESFCNSRSEQLGYKRSTPHGHGAPHTSTTHQSRAPYHTRERPAPDTGTEHHIRARRITLEHGGHTTSTELTKRARRSHPRARHTHPHTRTRRPNEHGAHTSMAHAWRTHEQDPHMNTTHKRTQPTQEHDPHDPRHATKVCQV